MKVLNRNKGYVFNPLKRKLRKKNQSIIASNRTSAHYRRLMLNKVTAKSREEIFHYHLIGNVLRRYLPVFLIGYYAWYGIIRLDPLYNDLSPSEIHDLINLNENEHIGTDLETACKEVAMKASKNEAALAAAEHQECTRKLVRFLSIMLLSIAVNTFFGTIALKT